MPRRKRRNEPGWGSLLGGLALAVAVSKAKQARNQQAFYRKVLNADDLLPEPLPYGSFTPSSLWPQQLEELAALVYTRIGYRNVKHTGAHSSTDGGVDVWMLSPEGEVEIVQCKQLKNKVDRGELIEFSKIMRQQHAERGHFWAPNGFTKPAVEYALSAGNLDTYVDYDISELVKKVYISEIDDQLHRSQIIAQHNSRLPKVKAKSRQTQIPNIIQALILVVLLITLGLIIFAGAIALFIGK
ncbi:MAG: restriction endonuclease [Anaerolineales bacterium]|nr:MAG: restriction endonuclease [Anaerolineales bacterium]